MVGLGFAGRECSVRCGVWLWKDIPGLGHQPRADSCVAVSGAQTALAGTRPELGWAVLEWLDTTRGQAGPAGVGHRPCPGRR